MTSKQDDASAAGTGRQTRVLAVLTAIGSASALCAAFLWRELLAARAGETPFCGFGDSTDCGDLWSATFASTIHNGTGMPVAGWGLVWALVAALLPLAALAGDGGKTRRDALATAIELTAAAGVAGVVVLLTASAAEGLFCTSCALTYVLTFVYAAVTFLRLRRPAERSARGVALAAAATVAAYLLLLYPGLATPKSATQEGQRALAEAPPAAEPAVQAAGSGGTVVGGVDVDRMLREFVATLQPQVAQGLSDVLDLYRQGATFPSQEPRVVALGEAGARILITEFTDALCSHCAALHATMEQIAGLLPPGSFRLDARHFPLDGRCNRHLQPRDGDDVRCLAAKAQICVEDTGRGFEFAGALFARQPDLTSEQVAGVAAPFIDRDALAACAASEATERKLADDVEYAWLYEPEGTPLVLIDGREGNPYPPFLYAIILAGGDPDHPAFASLPAPQPPPPHDHQH
jgi:protein-disulfide isomerase